MNIHSLRLPVFDSSDEKFNFNKNLIEMTWY